MSMVELAREGTDSKSYVLKSCVTASTDICKDHELMQDHYAEMKQINREQSSYFRYEVVIIYCVANILLARNK